MAGEAPVPKGHYHLKFTSVLHHPSLGGEARWTIAEAVRVEEAKGTSKQLGACVDSPLLDFLSYVTLTYAHAQ